MKHTKTQSSLLYKTRCPACAEKGRDRSGDNLGVYDDGHSYCWSCGYWGRGDLASRITSNLHKQVKPIQDLPEDISQELGQEALDWLAQYFDKPQRCLWSESEKKLFFMFPNGEYQYRYFGDNPKHPKWVGYGINENLIHIEGDKKPKIHHPNSLVLVEDIISAMKVGHSTLPTMCLFGSNISLKRLATIKQLGYDEVIIWLDWDKREYAIKAAQQAQAIGLKASVIHTQLDPKDYDYESIKRTLT